MNKCKKCNSENIEKIVKDLSSDNVVHIFKCKECGEEKMKIINLNIVEEENDK